MRSASPVAGDVPLRAGMEVLNPDTPKYAKTGKRKSGLADTSELSSPSHVSPYSKMGKAGGSVTKSKTGSVHPAEGGMPGQSQPDVSKTPTPVRQLTEFPEPTKGASKMQVPSGLSKAINDDDIDKTIAAFLTRRQQAHRSDLWELAISVDDTTPDKKSKVKPGARWDLPSAGSVEAMETNNAERSIVRKANQRIPKSNRPLALNKPTIAINLDEESANSRHSTPGRGCSSAEPSGSEFVSKLDSTQQGSCSACSGESTHPLAECPIHKKSDLNDMRVAQMAKNPGLVPSSQAVVPRRQSAEKSRSDSSGDSSDTGSSPVSVLAATPVTLSQGVSIAEAKSTIPKGLGISEVPIEADGEDSSSDSSTEGENEENGSARVPSSLDDPSGPVDLDDQLAALINGPAKSGSRKSILDEIPSSSEARSESSSEDLMLDEEEDLSKQPSHKHRRAHSKIRSSSIEPEHTSEDEEDVSAPVYMDTSHEVPDHPQVRILRYPGDLVKIDGRA
jgi:hypothetical protein